MPENGTPNKHMADWLAATIADLTSREAHIVKAAAVIIECSGCGGIHIRGYRNGAEASPDPLLDRVEFIRATGRTVQ